MYVNCTDCQDGSNRMISDLKDLELKQSDVRLLIVIIRTRAHTSVEIVSVF